MFYANIQLVIYFYSSTYILRFIWRFSNVLFRLQRPRKLLKLSLLPKWRVKLEKNWSKRFRGMMLVSLVVPGWFNLCVFTFYLCFFFVLSVVGKCCCWWDDHFKRRVGGSFGWPWNWKCPLTGLILSSIFSKYFGLQYHVSFHCYRLSSY